MEFVFEPICDQLRAGSSYLDMSQTGLKLVADLHASSLQAS